MSGDCFTHYVIIRMVLQDSVNTDAITCVYWMTIWDAGWLLYVSAINITSGHSADCPCLTWGKALPGAAPCHPAASLQHRHWSYAATYDHSLRIPEWKAQFLDMCNLYYISIHLFSPLLMCHVPLKVWKVWRCDIDNFKILTKVVQLSAMCIISSEFISVGFYWIRMCEWCSLPCSALGAVLSAVHVLTGICWQ